MTGYARAYGITRPRTVPRRQAHSARKRADRACGHRAPGLPPVLARDMGKRAAAGHLRRPGLTPSASGRDRDGSGSGMDTDKVLPAGCVR
jgi:hypothetical protein